MSDADLRLGALEREVRRLRRLVAALAGAGALVAAGAVVACKDRAKPMTELVFERDGRRVKLDGDGLYLSAADDSTLLKADGLFVSGTHPQLGARSASVSPGSLSSECEGSMAQMTTNKLGGQILITDRAGANASLAASQGVGKLSLWKQGTRVELSAHEQSGELTVESGSEARIVADPESTELRLRTGADHEKRVSSLDKR